MQFTAVELSAFISSDMSESSPPVEQPFLQEFEPLTNLLARVPRRIENGVQTCDVMWTCVDVTDYWVVVGTDAGVVYAYSRPHETVVHQLTAQVTAIVELLMQFDVLLLSITFIYKLFGLLRLCASSQLLFCSVLLFSAPTFSYIPSVLMGSVIWSQYSLSTVPSFWSQWSKKEKNKLQNTFYGLGQKHALKGWQIVIMVLALMVLIE